MKNWKTTVAGFITAVGVALSQSDDEILQLIGKALMVIGPIIFGVVAKDSNVTGGSVPQATPPGVQESTKAMGVAESK
jgi:hypothetical protein